MVRRESKPDARHSAKRRPAGRAQAAVPVSVVPNKPGAALDLQLFRALIDDAGDALLILDGRQGTILDCNAGACAAVGRDRDDLLGSSYVELDRDAAAMTWPEWKRLARATDGQARPLRWLKGDHEAIMECTAKVVEVASNEYMVLVGRDATERLEGERARLKRGEDLLQVVRTLPDVLFICEKRGDGKIYWTLNEGKLAEEFHLTTEEIKDKSLEELFEGGASEHIKEEFERSFRGESHIWTNEMGGRFFRHYPQPIFDEKGNVDHVIGFIADVTDLVEAEKRVQFLNESLEAKVAELAEANRDLEAFNYTVSHDLRSHISGVDALIQVQRAKTQDHVDEEGQARFGKMRTNLATMTGMIEGLLEFARAGRAPLGLERVDITGLAREIAHELASADERHAVTPRIQEGMSTNGDPRLLRIVLENLMANAWKYAGGQGAATVSVGARGNGHETVFSVRDDGPGFDAAEAERLFEAFHRTEGAKHIQGLGIGLATVARIVSRHGGRVWAESDPGNGATFCFALPDKAGDA